MSTMIRRYRNGAAAAVLTLVAIGFPGTASAALFSFIAVLNSGQEIQSPKPTSNAQGTALLTLDTSTKILCYSISFTALDSDEAAAHFHGPASAGENGPIIFPILQVGSPKTGCVGPLSIQNVRDLKKGLIYINVHSSTNPAGEIRGQVFRMIGAKTHAQLAD